MALINRFEHLAGRPQHEAAKDMLLKTASLVKPIMKNHGWMVGTLGEFFPDNPSLLGLNINGGAKILLRLRPPHDPDKFYEQEQIVLVMLHELTHNKFGPHDDKFYGLLKELEKEWDELKSKGYTGEGFLSNGARLGGSHSVPTHIGRIKGLEAAEKRAAKQIMMGKGGVLGGSGAGKGKNPREMALLAAERRIKDQKSCGHDKASAEEESRKAASQSIGTNAVDLTSDEVENANGPITFGAAPSGVKSSSEVTGVDTLHLTESSDEEAPGSKISPPALADTARIAKTVQPGSTSTNPPARTNGIGQVTASKASGSRLLATSRPQAPVAPSSDPAQRIKPTSSSSHPPPATTKLSNRPSVYIDPSGTWSCPTCTLTNMPDARRCEACTTFKPGEEAKGWWCAVCGGFGNRHEYWSCGSCGAIKTGG